jgi:hypothetical protein
MRSFTIKIGLAALAATAATSGFGRTAESISPGDRDGSEYELSPNNSALVPPNCVNADGTVDSASCPDYDNGTGASGQRSGDEYWFEPGPLDERQVEPWTEPSPDQQPTDEYGVPLDTPPSGDPYAVP